VETTEEAFDDEAMMHVIECVQRRDLDALRRLSQQDTRVKNAEILFWCVFDNAPLNFLRCLIRVLDADVNQARTDGTTALLLAAQQGNLETVRCLVA
jgi:ankyrin repeat protein